MWNKKQMGKICAGFLATLMIFTSMPSFVLAQEDNIMDGADIEEENTVDLRTISDNDLPGAAKDSTEEQQEDDLEENEVDENAAEENEENFSEINNGETEESSETEERQEKPDSETANLATVSENELGSAAEPVMLSETSMIEELTLDVDQIASGSIRENYGDIDWSIDKNGRLVVSGTGNYHASADTEAPWYEYRESIITAEITLTGATDAGRMFNNCVNLTSVDLSGFDTSKVTNMTAMFQLCGALESLDLGGFNTKNVTNMRYMFAHCRNMREVNLTSFDTKKVTNMEYMFEYCESLTSLYLNNFKTDSVMDMTGMFLGCKLENLDLSSFRTDRVFYTKHMFCECENLKSLDLSRFNTGIVSNMEGMFWGCKSLRELNLGNFDTKKVKNMTEMFSGCKNLVNLNISSFNTENVTEMSGMFDGCENLESLDLSHFSTGKVRYMDHMFCECRKLKRLDISRFDISNTVGMEGMFKFCENMESLDLHNFNMSNVRGSSEDILYGMEKLKVIFAPKSCKDNVKLPAENSFTWADAKGNSYTSIPKHAYSLNLYRSDYTGERTEGETPVPDEPDEEPVDEKIILSTVPFTVTDVRDVSREKTLDVNSGKQAIYIFGSVSTCLNTQKTLKNLTELIPNTDMSKIDIFAFEIRDSDEDSVRLALNSCKISDQIHVSMAVSPGAARNFFMECGNKIYGSNSFAVVMPLTLYKGTTNEVYANTRGNQSTEEIKGNIEKGGLQVGNQEDDKETEENNNECVVVFDSQGGTDVKSIKVIKNKLVSEPIVPVRDGYTFLGWYLNNKIYDFNQPVIENMVLRARWKLNAAESAPDESEQVDKNDVPESGTIPEGLWIAGVADQIYTGKAIKPAVRVYSGKRKLKAGRDYIVSYKNNVKANDSIDAKRAPAVIVKGNGNYSGTATANFIIRQVEMYDNADISVEDIVLAYTGKIQKQAPIVQFQGKKLSKGKDYEVTYSDTSVGAYQNIGSYLLEIRGKGNFAGIRTIKLHITKKQLISKAKAIKIKDKKYQNGEAITLTGSELVLYMKNKNNPLIEGKDYILRYENNTQVGTASAIVEGINEYAGSKKLFFVIRGDAIQKASVQGVENRVYTGMEQEQDFTVTLNGKQLIKDQDYRVSYEKNINVGTARLTISGIGAYSGTLKKTFKIAAYDIKNDEKKMLHGLEKTIVCEYVKGGCKPEVTLYFGERILISGKDYTVIYKNNNAVAEATSGKAPNLTIKGKGNFKGSVSVNFSIVKRDLAATKFPVNLCVADVGYMKGAGKYISKPVLTDMSGKALKDGSDYETEYSLPGGKKLDKRDTVPAGRDVCVTILGKGKYEGEMTATYRITDRSFANTVVKVASKTYTGHYIYLEEQDITVKQGKIRLVYGEDYEILEDTYTHNLEKGTASVKIRGIGTYGGIKTIKFRILPQKIENFSNMIRTYMFSTVGENRSEERSMYYVL